jgi:CheY-like chemotaxis protein
MPLNTEVREPQRQHPQVLIVDDDTSILRMLQRTLAAYHPVTAQGATEALALLEQCRPALLITDYLMPDMTGAELLARAREQHPNLKALILTGYGALLEQEPWWGREQHLAKPCTPAQLRAAVADLIGRPVPMQVA